MKTVKMFGKSVPILAIVMISVLAVGTFAAVLDYYGMIVSTSQVSQSVLVDGEGWTPPLEETIRATGGNTVVKLHYLKNMAEVSIGLMFVDATQDPAVSVRYDTVITDDKSQFAEPPETLFGARSNEVVALENPGLTLDELFAGEGLQYTYTVLDGGLYVGASPIIAVIDIEDGRHIALFPGWGEREGEHTLQYSDTVAQDTGGNNVVDFVVYAPDFGDRWSNMPSYPAWTETKALEGCPVIGSEVVTRIAIQHQAAGTFETDRLDSLAIGSDVYKFLQIEEGELFVLGAGQEAYFVIRYTFAENAFGTYTITTEVLPLPR